MSALASTTAAPAERQATSKREGKATAKPKPKVLDFTSDADAEAVSDSADIIDLFSGESLPPFWQACETLARAMERGTDRPLPKQALLEQHFDQALDSYGAVWSAEIRSLLDALGAEAAVVGERMALRGEDVSFETLKHETAHLLQVAQGYRSPAKLESGLEQAEAEAEVLSETAQTGLSVEAGLAGDVIAFRDAGAAEGEQTDWEASQEYRNEAALSEATPDVEEGAETPGEEAEASENEGVALPGEVDLGPEGNTEAPNIESELPPLSAEAEAAKAAVEESIAALEAAVSPELYMEAFKAAPPSVKAEKEPVLDAELARLADAEKAAHDETLPEFSATLHADESDVPEVEDVAAPGGEAGPLEAQEAAPAPDPDIAPTQELGSYSANDSLNNWRPFGAEAMDARDVGRALSGVSTTDESVETTPGPPPAVPLEGESDPERANEQATAATENAEATRGEAMQAVIDGPGPEQAQLRAMDEPVPLAMEESETALAEQPAIEGTQELMSMELDAQSKAIFDADHGPGMEQSMATAQAEMDAMALERDSQRDAAGAQADADMQAAEAEANADQVRHVSEARQSIQDERQATVDDQQTAVDEMSAEAEAENRATQADISARVAEDEAEITRQYTEAETEAEGELNAAEAEAERERERAEEEAEDESWWDAAVDFVADALAALGDLIGDIFDAVRSAITTILDAVKDAAFALIDAAASFIKDAIALYGELLQLAVTALIGSIFPELAEALNAAIREGVRIMQEAVDAVAEGLKAAVNALVEAYKAALLAVLAFVEGALNTVLAVAMAVLTGDWAEVARLVLEPILAALGINKDDFYAFVGNALDAITKIVNDPIQFLTYLMEAVIGGFRRFGDNFVDHLIAGIIGWLTGAFGGSLTLPTTWDLWGVLDIARQILGLTLDMLRRVAVRILGEAAVEKIEFFLGYAAELIQNGWSALWEKIQQDLSGLFDMVMGQITTFLMERVVKAGVIWLASLINPAGALVKVIMMIWDAIMWLKDNLGRFVQIIQTVTQGMIDIANGNTTPASIAVEETLKRLLAPTIDLIARLIGLGNVAERVQRIFQNIQQTIEDAAVKLIRNIVARFTGRGGGGRQNDNQPGQDGDLMTPIRFSGGGQNHTLYAEEQGSGTVPIMRSTPTPVETWLNGLKGAAGVKRELEKDDPQVSDAAVAEMVTKLGPFVTRALGEEAEMDQTGDAAKQADDRDPATAADEKALLETKARDMAEALEEILVQLGLTSGVEFKVQFASDIAGMNPDFKTSLEGEINRRINGDPAKSAEYLARSWAQVKARLGADNAVLVNAWARPLHSSGLLRGTPAFMTALYSVVAERADAKKDDLGIPDPAIYNTDTDAQGKVLTELLKVGDSAAVVTPLIERVLGPRSVAFSDYANELHSQIDTALGAIWRGAEDDKPDFAFKDRVKAAAFREGGLFETRAFASLQLPYYEQQDATGGAVGAKQGDHPLSWFMNKVPAGSSAGSKRAQKNITYTADMVRAASPGNHEWILASQANAAIAATVRAIEAARSAEEVTEGAEGFANFVHFQHHVRTETSNLVFEPAYANRTNLKEIRFVTPAHLTVIQDTSLSDEDRAEALTRANATAGLAAGTDVPALQAHAGGLYAVVLNADGTATEQTGSWSASPRWHEELRAKMGDALADAVSLQDMRTLGNAVIETLEGTALSDTGEAAPLKTGGVGHPMYRFTGSGAVSFGNFNDLIDEAISRYQTAHDDLERKINEVIN